VIRPGSLFALAVILCVGGGCGGNDIGSVLSASCEHEAACDPEGSNVAECRVALTSALGSLDHVFGPSCTDPAIALLECETAAPCNDTSQCDDLDQAVANACHGVF